MSPPWFAKYNLDPSLKFYRQKLDGTLEQMAEPCYKCRHLDCNCLVEHAIIEEQNGHQFFKLPNNPVWRIPESAKVDKPKQQTQAFFFEKVFPSGNPFKGPEKQPESCVAQLSSTSEEQHRKQDNESPSLTKHKDVLPEPSSIARKINPSPFNPVSPDAPAANTRTPCESAPTNFAGAVAKESRVIHDFHGALAEFASKIDHLAQELCSRHPAFPTLAAPLFSGLRPLLQATVNPRTKFETPPSAASDAPFADRFLSFTKHKDEYPEPSWVAKIINASLMDPVYPDAPAVNMRTDCESAPTNLAGAVTQESKVIHEFHGALTDFASKIDHLAQELCNRHSAFPVLAMPLFGGLQTLLQATVNPSTDFEKPVVSVAAAPAGPAPGPSAPGPTAPGPTATGPAATGPAASGPATSAPTTTAPATTVPTTSAPTTSAPATSAPATSAPATTAPTTSAPATTAATTAPFGPTVTRTPSSLLGTAPTVSKPPSSLFSTASTVTQPPSSLFGTAPPAPAATKPSSTLFGTAPTAPTVTTTPSSLFGTAPTVSKPPSSLFSTASTVTQPPSSLFNTAPSVPAVTKAPSSLFGTAPSAPAATKSPSSLFNTAPSEPAVTKSPSSLFGTAPSAPAATKPPSSLFNTAPPTPAATKPSSSLFGTASTVTTTPSSLFAEKPRTCTDTPKITPGREAEPPLPGPKTGQSGPSANTTRPPVNQTVGVNSNRNVNTTTSGLALGATPSANSAGPLEQRAPICTLVEDDATDKWATFLVSDVPRYVCYEGEEEDSTYVDDELLASEITQQTGLTPRRVGWTRRSLSSADSTGVIHLAIPQTQKSLLPRYMEMFGSDVFARPLRSSRRGTGNR